MAKQIGSSPAFLVTATVWIDSYQATLEYLIHKTFGSLEMILNGRSIHPFYSMITTYGQTDGVDMELPVLNYQDHQILSTKSSGNRYP